MVLRGAKSIGQAKTQGESIHVVGVRSQDASGHARRGSERHDQRADELIKAFLAIGVAPGKGGAAKQ
eukprot:7887783-Lingulodinium_polyedra.AAC.1